MMSGDTSENPISLFKELQVNDEQQPEVTEIESVCFQCYGNGITKLMLTKIPHFKEIIISSFLCEACGFENRDIKSGGRIQEKGQTLTLNVNDVKDLDRQVIKSEDATFSVPKLEFEQPPSKKGEITTVEGLIDNVRHGLEQDQIRRRIEHPDLASQIDTFIQKWIVLKELKDPFTFVIDDISGNSFIENPAAPKQDPNLLIKRYTRTTEQDQSLGLNNASAETAALSDADEEVNIKDEVMVFKDNCPNCNSPCNINMKMIDIPHFKEVVIMATNCDACGLRENEVKSFHGIAEKGKKITLKITDSDDISRDLLKSDSCGFQVPELDFELLPGTLGGKFTTVEGLLDKVQDQLKNNQFLVGDSAQQQDKEKMEKFCDKLREVAEGKLLNVHIILDDPTGNSYLQNLYAPDPDPNMEITEYERTPEQNEELGLLDMKTENYSQES